MSLLNHIHDVFRPAPLPQVNTVLYTRDGRTIGNAIVTKTMECPDGSPCWEIRTDYDNTAVLTLPELRRLFHFGDLNPTHKHASKDWAETPLVKASAMQSLMVTLMPSFPHFAKFAQDSRLDGIRLNSAMLDAGEDLSHELALLEQTPCTRPMWFDIKGRQPRVVAVHHNTNYLDLTLNHPIRVPTPTPVLFKAGADHALLERLEEGGRRLIFRGGPRFQVRPGESLHIRHPSLEIEGPLFTDAEKAKITKVRAAGIRKWFLSYVEQASDVDEFQELVGKDAEIMLKIESQEGLRYVSRDFIRRDNLTLVAARGDLYVEIDRPHHIPEALRLIINKDPRAVVGSRLFLSVVQTPEVPSCADFLELAWLMDIGYRRFLLCDEMCLKESLLEPAVNAFTAFKIDYQVPN